MIPCPNRQFYFTMLARVITVVVNNRFIIPALSGRPDSVVSLTGYLERGEVLRGDRKCKELSAYLGLSVAFGLSQQSDYPMYFFFVAASSGMGKSQLAFSLSLPVVYIPLSTLQSIYGCFRAVSEELQVTLYEDAQNVDLFPGGFTSTAVLPNRDVPNRAVGLLVALCRAVRASLTPNRWDC